MKATSGLPKEILSEDPNNAPVFDPATAERDVPENSAAGTDVGDPIAEATDADTGDTLEYSLEGDDARFFDFDASTRQITTRANVTYNYEAAKNSYEVKVKADDGSDSATLAVTIRLTDVAERPAKPAPPTLSPISGSSTTLTASWEKPDLDGGPDITGYALQYRAGTAGSWEDFAHGDTAVTTTITGLTADTEYQVQVRAKNGETDSDWSDASDAVSTNAEGMSDPPTITTVTVTSMPVVETDTYGAGETIEISVTFSEAVSATSDTDFVLNADGAKRAPLLSGSGTATLVFGYTVTPADVDTNGIWIGGQDRTLVGNRNGNSQTGEITSVATGVAADLTHDALGTQSGHKVNGLFSVDNNRPVFSEGDSTTREVANDSLVGTRVGAPVTATDLDNDQLAYSLENHNPNLFIVGPTSAYIYTVSNGSYSCASYGVTVKADDGKGGTDTIAVTINITGLGAGFTESEDCTEVSTEAGDGPDLVVGSPAVSHDSPVAGATFTFSATVRNAGDTDSPTTILRYYRSTDAMITMADTVVDTTDVGPLNAFDNMQMFVSLTAPEDPGTYYYGACVDAVADEADTTNNCSDSVQVTVAGEPPEDDVPPEGDDDDPGADPEPDLEDDVPPEGDDDDPGPGPDSDPDPDPEPDLVVGSPAVSDDSPVAGATFTFSATVRNAGDTDSPATTTLRYYRSTDATISTADSEEGNGAVGALAASASSRESVELTAPSTPGAYYYGACVDAVSGEADTTNNCSTAVQVDVSEAEPVPALPLLGQLLLALGLAAGGAGLARRRGAPTA